MKKSVLIFIIVVAIVLTIAVAWFMKKKKDQQQSQSSANDSSNPSTGNYTSGTGSPSPKPTTPAEDDTWPLKRGSKGERVKLLQIYLAVTADGVFGPATEAAAQLAFGKAVIEKNDLGANILSLKNTLNREKSLNPQGNYFPLVAGTTGYYVRLFQLAAGITIDGKFGTGSIAAAKSLLKTESVTDAQLRSLISNKYFGSNLPIPSNTTSLPSIFAFLPKLF